jgi:hypothetical protein
MLQRQARGLIGGQRQRRRELGKRDRALISGHGGKVPQLRLPDRVLVVRLALWGRVSAWPVWSRRCRW